MRVPGYEERIEHLNQLCSLADALIDRLEKWSAANHRQAIERPTGKQITQREEEFHEPCSFRIRCTCDIR